MPYGKSRSKRRSYRRGTPIKRRKKRVAKRRGKVRAHVRNLQTSTGMPKARTVMMTDSRTWIVEDNSMLHGDNDSHNTPIPIMKVLNLNNPHQFWGSQQGTWSPTDYGSPPSHLPNLDFWVTDLDGVGTGLYRTASAQSCKVTISAVWINEKDNDPAQQQAVSKLIVSKISKLTDVAENTTPGLNFNADSLSGMPYTKSANLWQNLGGTARGSTITTNYSYKRMNAQKRYQNFFSNSSGPLEKDFLSMFIMPQNKEYNTTGFAERCGKFRIQIAVEMLVNLSEPNTLYTAQNKGNIMAAVAQMMQ